MVGIVKTPAGRTVWLETGNTDAVLQHIVAGHSQEFASWGLTSPEEMSNFILDTVRDQEGAQSGGATLYDMTVDGKARQLQVVIGDNGFIVTAYPFSR